jgi:LDH2 family malate/lactate/ureidoglycolate dehydrogenase
MAVSSVRAILLDPKDDVAAVLDSVGKGDIVTITDAVSGKALMNLGARQEIPFGHKVALREIASDKPVFRYGWPIGIATAHIRMGEHVHSHNMRSALSPAPKQAAREPLMRSAQWVRNLVNGCVQAAGGSPESASAMAEAITEAHLRGVETHGLRRLSPYIARIRSGGVQANAPPHISAAKALLHVDGRNGIGHHVASVAARAASEAAREFGIAIALVKNSNHFGFAGYYATLIAAEGQLGIISSNGQVCVGPEGAMRPVLSNNPLAIAAPLPERDAFLELDIATSATSRANVVEAAKFHALLPSDWAQDCSGISTRDPAAALAGSLLAFGGEKGFGLLVALEALTGVLCGGAFADEVSSKEAAPGAPEGTAHTLIAIDLETALGRDAYAERLDQLIRKLKELPVHRDAPDVRYPGERRWKLRRERLRNGVPLSQSEIEEATRLANELGVSSHELD